jgi:hypothetical protein
VVACEPLIVGTGVASRISRPLTRITKLRAGNALISGHAAAAQASTTTVNWTASFLLNRETPRAPVDLARTLLLSGMFRVDARSHQTALIRLVDDYRKLSMSQLVLERELLMTPARPCAAGRLAGVRGRYRGPHGPTRDGQAS